MKALVLKNKEEVIIDERPMPILEKNHAVVKITYASICGSDISAYRGKGVQVPYPVILGHEVSGTILEIDSETTDLKVGDRVILNPYISCGKCYPCSLGKTNCCESLKVLGVQTDGAISEYFSHPVDLLIKVPSSIEDTSVPLIEPLVIALHGIRQAKLVAGEHLAIIGAGPIGILAAMIARAYKAKPILIDILDSRLEYSKELGIDYVINSLNENVIERISEITNGRLAEVVLEMSGSNQGIEQALEIASYCGRISFTGWPTGKTELNTSLITRKELQINGARTGVMSDFEEAIRLVESNEVQVEKIITEVITLDDAPMMIEKQSSNQADYLKLVVKVNQ